MVRREAEEARSLLAQAQRMAQVSEIEVVAGAVLVRAHDSPY